MEFNWGALLVAQLEFYWDVHLWPRLHGLTDEEYFWEPVDGCWSVRLGASGMYVLDSARPEPSPPPFTTIAWRMVHVGATCLANRASTFFGDGSVPADATMFDRRHVPVDLPGSAAGGMSFLEQTYMRWHDGIAALDECAMRAPLGPRGGDYANDPMAGLVAHINREVMHHGGEICLLRDLYRSTGTRSRGSRLVPES
jgi:DinB superfamily